MYICIHVHNFICGRGMSWCVIIACMLYLIYFTVDCEWEWGEFEECSVTCGGGTKKRYPIITKHPQHGGKPCEPDVVNNVPETMTCNTNPCPGNQEYC